MWVWSVISDLIHLWECWLHKSSLNDSGLVGASSSGCCCRLLQSAVMLLFCWNTLIFIWLSKTTNRTLSPANTAGLFLSEVSCCANVRTQLITDFLADALIFVDCTEMVICYFASTAVVQQIFKLWCLLSYYQFIIGRWTDKCWPWRR